MKKIIVFTVCCIFSFSIMAQQDTMPGKPPMKTKKYCVMMKSNRLVVMNEGNEITGPVKLPNGAKINTDATYVQSNGIKRALTDGECVDPDGNIIMPKGSKEQDNEKIIPKM